MSDDRPTNLSDLPPEARAALQGDARDFVRTTGIAKTQKASRDKRKRKGGGLHKNGKHWYALESYFGPKLIESTPIEDGGFMMGALEDWIVVEVKADWPPEKVQALATRLTAMGMSILVVQAGVRFLRLRGVTGDEEKNLDEILAKQKAAREEAPGDS